MKDVGRVPVSGVTPQPAVGASPGTVMKAHELREGAGPEASHTRVDLIEGVPGDTLLDPADGLQTLDAVAPERPRNMVVDGYPLEVLPPPSSLDPHSACQSQPRVAREALQQHLEVAGRQLDVAIELRDVAEARPVHRPDAGVERS